MAVTLPRYDWHLEACMDIIRNNIKGLRVVTRRTIIIKCRIKRASLRCTMVNRDFAIQSRLDNLYHNGCFNYWSHSVSFKSKITQKHIIKEPATQEKKRRQNKNSTMVEVCTHVSMNNV